MSAKVLSIMFHDVVVDENYDQTGFPGVGAARYKLTATKFRSHLQAIRQNARFEPGILDVSRSPRDTCYLTFDDGGLSAYTVIAPLLEEFGWQGLFFVTTQYIDTPTFLSTDMIRSLDRRGHIIGSHSHTHPANIASLSTADALVEWRTSTRILQDILGKPIAVASVPAGYYGPTILSSANEAGIKHLFTSEPTIKIQNAGCYVYGRYSIFDSTSSNTVGKLAAWDSRSRIKHALLWSFKIFIKRVLGDKYRSFRIRLLRWYSSS